MTGMATSTGTNEKNRIQTGTVTGKNWNNENKRIQTGGRVTGARRIRQGIEAEQRVEHKRATSINKTS